MANENAPEARQKLIDDLVLREWTFFQQVNNEGGRASCQSMPRTFYAMRSCQFAIWPDSALSSYMQDLQVAEEEGRNPLAEKYGYMERSTAPDEWEKIKHILPAISEEKSLLVESILSIQIPWAEEMHARYPHFMSQGRPIHTSEDSAFGTSIETYSRGELSTYSLRTLGLLYQHFSQAKEEGVNLQEVSDNEVARLYKYRDLDDAERAIAQGRMSGKTLDDQA